MSESSNPTTADQLLGDDPIVSLPGNADAGLSWAENHAPESLRMNSEAVLFARRAFNAGAAALRARTDCEWTREEDDIEGQSWLSACGERWCFNDGGPTENKMRYCHGCGGKLIEKGSAQ